MAQTQYEDKHGFFGTFIKVIMIIVFTLIGIGLIVLGSVAIGTGKDIGTDYNIRWLSIVNIVFGCLLFTSWFFLNKKREGLNKVIKILMVIIFVIIGIALIACGAYALASGYADAPKWLSICNIVFGCLLFTSPFFLKK